MREKSVPMRRCVGCMTSFPKKEIVRLALADGVLIIDQSGKQNGRGAYLCRSMDCFDMAIKKKRIAYALGVQLTPEDAAKLREEYAAVTNGAEVNE